MAKLPRPQFEHLRQAVDNHYMHHLRQDAANGQDPDQVRTPKHRLADVVFELLTNRNAFTGEFITETVGIKAKASTQLILTAPIGVVDGTNPQRTSRDHRSRPRTPPDPPNPHPRHEVSRHDLRPEGPSPLVGPKPAIGQHCPTPRRRHPRRRLLRVRRPHAQMRTPPHEGMAPRPRTHQHRQPRRRLPPPPQMVRIQQPRSPENPQRLPNPTPRRSTSQSEAPETARTRLTKPRDSQYGRHWTKGRGGGYRTIPRHRSDRVTLRPANRDTVSRRSPGTMISQTIRPGVASAAVDISTGVAPVSWARVGGKREVSASWDWPGSRWWRVDLHCHSPASHDFRSDQASSAPDWIGWVEAARDAGLGDC